MSSGQQREHTQNYVPQYTVVDHLMFVNAPTNMFIHEQKSDIQGSGWLFLLHSLFILGQS